jgi:hypothetical protein
MFANTAQKPWRDQHSGKSSPDSYRYSSSLSSQVALDTPSSEPVTPAEGPLLVLPKRRGQNAKNTSKKPHHRNKSREERSSTSIDLSRSSIELEGLGIYTNLERDTRFQQNRGSASNLHRSISQISSSPSITRLGQSYVHPRRQLPTASTTPSSIRQRHSVDERYFTAVNRSLTAIGSTALSIPDDDSVDDNDDTNSPEEAETPTAASIDYRHSTPVILQRAHTDTAINTGISSSWTPSEHLSSAELASHAAAVRAARVAFAKKEATKARKLEEQQKKVQQRDERRHQRSVSYMPKPPPAAADRERPELHRRAVSEAFSPRESFTDNDIGEENLTLQEGVPATTATTTTPPTPTPIVMGPPKLPAATKHNWNKFLTWGKTRYYKAKRKVSVPVSTAVYR